MANGPGAGARSQEGLPADETMRADQTVLFPAEELPFVRDDPRGSAGLNVPNGPLLRQRGAAGHVAPASVQSRRTS
jgi:hypothetical protein